MGKKTKWTLDEKQAWAVSKLIEKQKEIDRHPRKSDFDVATLSRIKAFLGPWPRALAKAGIKETTKVKSSQLKSTSSKSHRKMQKVSDEKNN